MAKSEKPAKAGFVIKLSSETVQKLADEEHLSKSKQEEAEKKSSIPEEVEVPSENSKHTSNISQAADENSAAPKASTEKTDREKTSSSAPQVNTAVTSDNQESLSQSTESENSWGDYAPYITYEGKEAIYTDPTTQQKYNWNNDSNTWEAKPGETEPAPGRVYSFEDDTHIYTEADGSKFFWDEEKKAWIPKVDDDFLAFYQMSYGFVDNSSKDEDKKVDTKKETKQEPTGTKRKNEPEWFQPPDEKNTKVYVSNLPEDLTEEEFVAFMQKCGLVERDPFTQKMKVKLYMDKEHNCFKGDALCTYIKIESVDLALKLLDGCEFKGNKIKVERAHFQLKGEYNPALKPKKKKKKELEKIKKMQQKLFDWRPEKFIGERAKHERVVIVKNLFHPSDFDKEVQLILDYQQDLREECSKCGEVRKVVIYDRHPEGVAQVTMKEPEQADAAVQLINGRWFGKRQITAEIWDGRTKYRIAETEADINRRIDKWGRFLDGNEEAEATAKQTAVAQEQSAAVQEQPAVAQEQLAAAQEQPSVAQEPTITTEAEPAPASQIKESTCEVQNEDKTLSVDT